MGPDGPIDNLTVWLHFIIHLSNNSFFKFTVGALRTDHSEFQSWGTLEAELVSFCIQRVAWIGSKVGTFCA